MERRFRVGIVGLSAKRGWATTAHVPALRALSDYFELVGVANTSLTSAESLQRVWPATRIRERAALIASPDIDVVIVTVKVSHHREVVTAALQNRKSVYCEWPLGNGLTEALELARLANDKKVLAVVGNSGDRFALRCNSLRKMVADGYVGEVLSSDLHRCGVYLGR